MRDWFEDAPSRPALRGRLRHPHWRPPGHGASHGITITVCRRWLREPDDPHGFTVRLSRHRPPSPRVSSCPGQEELRTGMGPAPCDATQGAIAPPRRLTTDDASPSLSFDGECALCNGFVSWLIRHDPHAVFLIAGSAGDVGKAVVAAAGLEGSLTASTIVVWDGSRGLIRSDAVLAIARQLPWPWRLVAWGRVMPRSWRDRCYRFIASRRSRVMAEDPACGVPPPELVATWRARLATASDLVSVK